MERNDIKIDIAEILKDKLKGTKLYCKLIGDCKVDSVSPGGKEMTVGERAKIDAKIAQLKEIAAKYGGEKTINSIIEQLEEFIELRRNE